MYKSHQHTFTTPQASVLAYPILSARKIVSLILDIGDAINTHDTDPEKQYSYVLRISQSDQHAYPKHATPIHRRGLLSTQVICEIRVNKK